MRNQKVPFSSAASSEDCTQSRSWTYKLQMCKKKKKKMCHQLSHVDNDRTTILPSLLQSPESKHVHQHCFQLWQLDWAELSLAEFFWIRQLWNCGTIAPDQNKKEKKLRKQKKKKIWKLQCHGLQFSFSRGCWKSTDLAKWLWLSKSW